MDGVKLYQGGDLWKNLVTETEGGGGGGGGGGKGAVVRNSVCRKKN